MGARKYLDSLIQVQYEYSSHHYRVVSSPSWGESTLGVIIHLCLTGTAVRQNLKACLAEVRKADGGVGVRIEHSNGGGGSDGTPDGEELELGVFIDLARFRGGGGGGGGSVRFCCVGINQTTVESPAVAAVAAKTMSSHRKV